MSKTLTLNLVGKPPSHKRDQRQTAWARLKVVGQSLFQRAARLAKANQRPRLWVGLIQRQQVEEGAAHNRVAADAHAGALAQPVLA